MEFYIKHIGDPNFQRDKLQQDDDLAIMLTQIETILFTRRGSVLGNPEFGVNLEDYVYEFSYNDYQIKNLINKQIKNFVSLSNKYPVDVQVEFAEESNRYIMFLDITIDARIKIGIFI